MMIDSKTYFENKAQQCVGASPRAIHNNQGRTQNYDYRNPLLRVCNDFSGNIVYDRQNQTFAMPSVTANSYDY